MQSNPPYLQKPKHTHARRRKRRATPWKSLLLISLTLGLVALIFWSAIQVINPLLKGMDMLIRQAGATVQATDFQPTEDTAPIPDITPPIIRGVKKLEVYQGDVIQYLRGVTVEDDIDLMPTITVDSSRVDLTTPGTYKIHYLAQDAAGNKVTSESTVTVLEKKPGFVDMETIYAIADKKIEAIIRYQATPKQQVQDIYAWARINLGYAGHSDRIDWRQTAYIMLTEGRGDCYGYWAVTKLLLERLGIMNLDVVKVRNFSDDSDHFWSLISLDGGQTWYHFDATPRYGDGDNFCLVTDAFLDAYSETHKGSHNRDKSLYPATP